MYFFVGQSIFLRQPNEKQREEILLFGCIQWCVKQNSRRFFFSCVWYLSWKVFPIAPREFHIGILSQLRRDLEAELGVYGVEIRLLARLWLALNPDNGRIHVIHFEEKNIFVVCIESENVFLCFFLYPFCLFSFCVFSNCLSPFSQLIFLSFFCFFFFHM